MKNYKVSFTVDTDQLHTLKSVFGDVAGMKKYLLSEAKQILSEVAGDSEIISIQEQGDVTEVL